jgi:deoxyribodipyrimidine photo-lyase
MKTIVWYRNDLRIGDHKPLMEAVERGDVIPVYIFDLRQFKSTVYGFPKIDILRARFLIESVKILRKNLRALGAELIVRVGLPENIIPALISDTSADQIYIHSEATSEETDAADRVENSVSIPLKKFWGHTLYHRDDLPFDLQTIPDVFTQFRKQLEKRSSVEAPLGTPSAIPFSIDMDPGEIPASEDLGLDAAEADSRSVLNFKGGEDEAWRRVRHYFFESDSLRNYKYTRNGLLGADYSSKFSPWLAHGCISARSIYAEVVRYEKEVHENVSTYWMKFELIWRDYFRFSAIRHGNQIFKLGGIQGKDLQKKSHPEIFRKWAEGRTGIPFIDANMRELNRTGYMSNRGRQNVASFLAQNLDFDWRWGAAYFESKLIDYDVCSNWGNWAYNATVGHDPRNRYFNILNQADKYDKKGDYMRLWIPELKDVPAEFIHEPHTMSIDQQKLFNAEIGKDYPEPMIDLESSYEEIRKRD